MANVPNKCGGCSFCCCDNLKDTIVRGETLIKVPSSIQGSYTIPPGITEIATGAFCHCKEITEVIIPEGLRVIKKGNFNNLTSLKTIHIPASVESIDERSFEDCGEIESITVDELNFKYDSRNQCNAIVETETNKIVRGCVNTKFVEDDCWENIKSIGSYAFSGCKNLEKVDIPNTIESIGSCTFRGCSLKTIHIPASVESIDENSFLDCGEVESITVDEANLKYDSRNQCNAIVETETNKIVRGCAKTKFVENMKIIGSCAFSGCKNLEKIDIPNTIVRIGSYAFSGCENLCNVIISEGVKHIDVAAFSGCNQIKTLKIPESYEPENDGLDIFGFNELASLETPIYNSRYFVALPKKIAGKYVVPDGIVEICSCAFKGCEALTEVSLPDSVRTISSHAFSHCHALQKVINTSKIEKIGKFAFEDCKKIVEINLQSASFIGPCTFCGCSLKKIHIPASLEFIDEDSFLDCGEVESITVDEANLKYDSRNQCNAIVETETNKIVRGCAKTKFVENMKIIGSCAFLDCKNLEKIDIPNTIVRIDSDAFSDCKNLCNVIISEGVKHIYGDAFSGCDKIKTLKIPESYEPENDKRAWSDFNELASLETPIYNSRYFVALPKKFAGKYVVPDGIVEICSCAFKGCEALTEVSLPDSVRTISFNAFANCHALQKVINTSKIKIIGESAFNGCEKLVEINLQNVSFIGKYAFYECKELTELEIPESVEIIGDQAFQGCANLQHVKLSDNLKEISPGLFKKCTRLSKIKLPSAIEKIGHSAFEECSSLESIIIPNGPEKIEYN